MKDGEGEGVANGKAEVVEAREASSYRVDEEGTIGSQLKD